MTESASYFPPHEFVPSDDESTPPRNDVDAPPLSRRHPVLTPTEVDASFSKFMRHTRKRGLPIVHAATLVRTKDAKDIIVEVFNAVYNPSADNSLLSEYQIRENGNIWDPVLTSHSKSSNEKGTCSFFVDTGRNQHQVPMEIRII